jgi:hypothetical protein
MPKGDLPSRFLARFRWAAKGGVLLEVSRHLKENNSIELNEQITINVISRGPAGGITAITAAQKLPYEDGP